MTNPEIEQLKQQLKEKIREASDIYYKLMDAGAFPLDDDDLDAVSGGVRSGGGGGHGPGRGPWPPTGFPGFI